MGLREVQQALELAKEMGSLIGERDEARKQVKELTERLQNCTCRQYAPIPVVPSPPWASGPVTT